MINRINSYRLINQQIAATKFTKPAEMVNWMVAMQAQEYAMAKWAIGLRLPGTNDIDIEEAFNKGLILRTHIMRPTWHFVSPEDIRWMTGLTAPRVHQVNAFTYRQMELNSQTLVKCTKIFEKALSGGRHLTRTALNSELEKRGVIANGIRLSAIMMYAELEAIICSGPRQGKQFTYALLEERVPNVKSLNRPEALARLSNQYFLSRGPASLEDFTTWSGLTVKEAREGISTLHHSFLHEKINEREYIFKPQETELKKNDQTSFLMPDYDEYGMGYKDRSSIFNPDKKSKSISRNNPIFNRMIIINGRIEGTWTRTLKGNSVHVETFPFFPFNVTDNKILNNAVKRYISFTENLNKPPRKADQ